MTPAARYAAAIEVLEVAHQGAAVEKVLTNWARRSRFAGSKDRAAVRDIVFDCLRNWQSFQKSSGIEGARGAALGHVLSQGLDPSEIFNTERFAPAPIGPEDQPYQGHVTYDMPAEAATLLDHAFGPQAASVADILRMRAGVHLRVNLGKVTIEQAQAALAAEGIQTIAIPPSGALKVTENPRKLAQSEPYLDGWVELQDAGSQAVVAALPVRSGDQVLDYCAGGGGKTLAIAAHWPDVQIAAYDASQSRLENLSARADRAGIAPTLLKQDPAQSQNLYDVVLLDVPCSGSGAWRRNPDGKWKFTQHSLETLCTIQAEILDKTQALVRDDGYLCYVTCSLFTQENEDQIDAFLTRQPDWQISDSRRFDPQQDRDGFYLSCLQKNNFEGKYFSYTTALGVV